MRSNNMDDPDFKSFVIDRNTVEEIGVDRNIGSRYIAAIFRGLARYDGGAGKINGTFICLHGDPGKGAPFTHPLGVDRRVHEMIPRL